LNQTDFQQEVVDQSRITHDVDPTHGTNDETDPKRQHDEQKKGLFITAFAAVEKIGGDIPHDKTEEDGFEGYADRANKYFWIEEIFKEFGVIAELKGGDVGSTGRAQPETVNNNEAHRDDQ